jgi:hypothetical protein
VDIYLGALLPDGVTFLSLVQIAPGVISTTLGPSPMPFLANMTLSQALVVPFSYTFRGTEPVGTYVTYAGLVMAGSDPFLPAKELSPGVQAFQFTTSFSGPTIPTLVWPVNNAAIKQNNPDIGCLPHPTRGFGFRIPFDWTDSSAPIGIAGYHIFAKHKDAQFPIVDGEVTASEFVDTGCNTFVIDHFLDGWEWRVRAKDTLGNFSPWSTTGTFRFEPCSLPDGAFCFAN